LLLAHPPSARQFRQSSLRPLRSCTPKLARRVIKVCRERKAFRVLSETLAHKVLRAFRVQRELRALKDIRV